MPRYGPVWLEIAERQYRDLPADLRELIDQRLGQLLENPTADPDAVYNERSDQWSVPLGDQGLLFYAVVQHPAKVIVLRLVNRPGVRTPQTSHVQGPLATLSRRWVAAGNGRGPDPAARCSRQAQAVEACASTSSVNSSEGFFQL